MTLRSDHYEALPRDGEDEYSASETSKPRTRALGRHDRAIPVFFLSATFNLFAIIVLAVLLSRSPSLVVWRGTKPQYSPAQSAVFHESRVFPSLTDRSKYHGPPSDEVDAAWAALYNVGISAIPGGQAALLPNKTAPYPGVEDGYIITLEIFHILHCLNTMREFAWPERFPMVHKMRYVKAHGVVFDHVDHCINAIRESVMCNADLAPDVWRPVKNAHGKEVSSIHFNTVHTCRNFDSIQDWARSRSPNKLDDKNNVELPASVIASHEEIVKAGLMSD